MRSTLRIGLAAVAALALAQMSASAQIIVQTGNNPQPNEENVLLKTDQTGNPVTGVTNKSGITVTLDSLTGQTLTLPSSGQARVEATDGNGQIDLTSLGVEILPGGSFEDLLFNAFIGGNFGDPDGSITIDVFGVNPADNLLGQTFDLGNGENKFTIVGTNGVRIQRVELTMSDGVADVRQIRISGASNDRFPPQEVPEPGTWAMMVGVAVPVLGLLRRRKA